LGLPRHGRSVDVVVVVAAAAFAAAAAAAPRYGLQTVELEASEAVAQALAIDSRNWVKSGQFVGRKCRRFFVNKKGKGASRILDGKVGACFVWLFLEGPLW
jgi:hypothetical protein